MTRNHGLIHRHETESFCLVAADPGWADGLILLGSPPSVEGCFETLRSRQHFFTDHPPQHSFQCPILRGHLFP